MFESPTGLTGERTPPRVLTSPDGPLDGQP